MISYFSKKYNLVALGSTRDEYMATSLANCEAIWIDKLFKGLFDQEIEHTSIHCDNQSHIKLS